MAENPDVVDMKNILNYKTTKNKNTLKYENNKWVYPPI